MRVDRKEDRGLAVLRVPCDESSSLGDTSAQECLTSLARVLIAVPRIPSGTHAAADFSEYSAAGDCYVLRIELCESY